MKRRAFVIGLTVTVLLLGGVAVASIPDGSGTVHGCYKTSNPAKGAVIVIDSDAGQSCPSGYTSLDWKVGPQPGTIVSTATVDSPFLAPSSGIGSNTVLCPPDHPKLLASLAWVTDNTGGVYITAINTRPDSDGGREGVAFLVQGGLVNNERFLINPRVICAEVIA